MSPVKGDYVQRFRAAKIESRLPILTEWVIAVLQASYGTNNVVVNINRAYEESKKFTVVPITVQSEPVITWFLSDDWLKEFLGQILYADTDKTSKKIFQRLKWSVKKALNPIATELTTVSELDISGYILNFSSLRLTLVWRDILPLGSVWKSKTGNEWEITGVNKGSYELTHLVHNLCNYRPSHVVYKNYTKVDK